MPARRLPAASTSEVERARVPFTFDGRPYEGVWGEPLAVSLLAAGRRTLSRSFRFHRPRGLMCSTGQCGWCECEVDGRPSVRTCRVPLRDGMVVRGEHAWPSVEHDLLGGLDVGSRLVPPGFYHHRFLRPRRLRKAYLDVIRAFGGRGRLGDGATSSGHGPRVVRRDEPDVLIVGGGRGGLLAAIAAAETAGGGLRIVVLEADAVVDGAGLLAEARSHGVEVRAGTAATGWYAGMITAIDDEAIWELRPRAVVAATGSYELVPRVAGSDKPGVMGARLALELLGRHGVLPGERALLVGHGEEVIAAAAALQEAGARVVGPIPTDGLRSIGGRGPVAWARFVTPGARVVGPIPTDGLRSIGGRGPVTWARFVTPGAGAGAGSGAVAGAGGGAAGAGASGRAAVRRERVELVIFGDRTPNLDLVLAAGGTVGWRDGRLAPDLGPDGQTSVPGLFVAGDAAGMAADSTGTEAQARQAGAAASSWAAGATGREAGAQTRPGTLRTGDAPRSASVGRPPDAGSAHAVLCFCEDVRGWEVRAELRAGYADPELVKRRTGALTGPCQGKYCLSAITCEIGGGEGVAARDDIDLPTGRPPLRPIRLRDLVTEKTPAATADPGHRATGAAAADHR